MPQTPAERQAAYRERQRAQRERDAAAGVDRAEQKSPVVNETQTEKIVTALRAKAEKGDVPAARELIEWVEIEKQTEGKAKDRRLLELLSPEQRDQVASWIYAAPLPSSWPHEKLTVEA
jgi:hypothetical protein